MVKAKHTDQPTWNGEGPTIQTGKSLYKPHIGKKKDAIRLSTLNKAHNNLDLSAVKFLQMIIEF